MLQQQIILKGSWWPFNIVQMLIKNMFSCFFVVADIDNNPKVDYAVYVHAGCTCMRKSA